MIFEKILPKLFGRNLKSTPKEVIIDQLNEPRPLPMGRKDFDEWAERLIAGALIPNESGKVFQIAGSDLSSDYSILVEGQKFVLANMLMHLGPTESHKPDAFFIHSLRKFAVNQVAHTIRKELHESAKARTLAQEEAQGKTKESIPQENVISLVKDI